jgi:hypothetical protein
MNASGATARHSRSFIDNWDERAELAIAEVKSQPRDDADQNRHEKHAVPGMLVGRDRAAVVGEHDQAADVTCFWDEVQDEHRQFDDPERQRGRRRIFFAPFLNEARRLHDLEEGAGEEDKGEDA